MSILRTLRKDCFRVINSCIASKNTDIQNTNIEKIFVRRKTAVSTSAQI